MQCVGFQFVHLRNRSWPEMSPATINETLRGVVLTHPVQTLRDLACSAGGPSDHGEPQFGLDGSPNHSITIWNTRIATTGRVHIRGSQFSSCGLPPTCPIVISGAVESRIIHLTGAELGQFIVADLFFIEGDLCWIPGVSDWANPLISQPGWPC